MTKFSGGHFETEYLSNYDRKLSVIIVENYR